MKKTLVLLLILRCLAFASTAEEQEAELGSNKAFLDLFEHLDEIKMARKKQNIIDREFINLNNLKIENDYQVIKMQNIVFLTIHPHIPHTVLLPTDIAIQSINATPNNSSVTTSIDAKGKNIIDIVATPMLYKTNLRINYEDAFKKKYVMNIFLEKYEDSNTTEKLYIGTRIERSQKITDEEVLSLFYDKKGMLPNNFDDIKIGNTNHIFVEDKLNGKILIHGTKFKILRK